MFIWEINADVIIENGNKNLNNFENVINKNRQIEGSLIFKFIEKYYDMSNLPSERINLFINSNVTFSGCLGGTVFDYKNNNNGIFFVLFE